MIQIITAPRFIINAFLILETVSRVFVIKKPSETIQYW